MDFNLLTIDERLSKYELMLNVALNDEEAKTLLAAYGYTEPVNQEGKGLFDKAYVLNQTQKKEYGEKFGATEVYQKARLSAYEMYIEFAELTRRAYKRDKPVLNELDLVGERERTHGQLLVQMDHFYDIVMADANKLQKLARFAITVERLQAGHGLVETMKKTYQDQHKETSEAQRATRDRDEAMDVLDDWMSDFIVVAPMAFKKQPEFLERMGIVDPS